MIRVVLILLAGMVLSSAAPAPQPLPDAVIAIRPRESVVVVAPLRQGCTYATAATRFREIVFDSRGYPFGEVSAWSCGGSQVAIDEFARRKAAMEAAAAAYVNSLQ